MNYVYRFLDQDNKVLYVGKTSRGMKSRMRQHFGPGGHIPKEKLIRVKVIEYIKIQSQLETNVTEMYLINLWKPEFNQKTKYKEISNFKPVEENKMLWKHFDLDELFMKLGYKIPEKQSYSDLIEENKVLNEMLQVCYQGDMFEYRKYYSEYDYAESVLQEGLFLKPHEINSEHLISLLDLLVKHRVGETSKTLTVAGEVTEYDLCLPQTMQQLISKLSVKEY